MFPPKILIVKNGALGDVVRTAFLLPGLWTHSGSPAQIEWLTSPGASDLLRFNPYVQRVLTSPSQLREHYDWVISLDDEESAAVAASAPAATKRSGLFVDRNQLSYTLDLAAWFDMGLRSRFGKREADRLKIENRLSHTEIFARALGITVKSPTFFNSQCLELSMRRQIRESAGPGRVIGINPTAGARWPSKRIPTTEVVELCGLLFSDPKTVARVVILTEDDRTKADLRSQLCAEGIVFPETAGSVLSFAAAISALDCLITTDSLALHLAVAQRIPSLSVYAPTSAAEIETFGVGVKLISTQPDYCSYSPQADNSDFTARNIYNLFRATPLLNAYTTREGTCHG